MVGKKATERQVHDGTKEQVWFIIASGPSLTKEDAEKTQHFNTIAINTNYQIAPHANVLYACDGLWWDQYYSDVKDNFKGELWTQDVKASKDYNLNYIESVPGNGFISHEKKIKQGQNSGYQAINLAYHLGAKLVVLLGYDMGWDGDKKRWHKDHPSPCGNAATYTNWAKNFDEMKPSIEVINCSRKTALTAFKTMDLDDFISKYN